MPLKKRLLVTESVSRYNITLEIYQKHKII